MPRPGSTETGKVGHVVWRLHGAWDGKGQHGSWVSFSLCRSNEVERPLTRSCLPTCSLTAGERLPCCGRISGTFYFTWKLERISIYAQSGACRLLADWFQWPSPLHALARSWLNVDVSEREKALPPLSCVLCLTWAVSSASILDALSLDAALIKRFYKLSVLPWLC